METHRSIRSLLRVIGISLGLLVLHASLLTRESSNARIGSLPISNIADGFDYPVGKPDGIGWLKNHGGLGFLDSYNYGGKCGWVKHPGNDFNEDGTTGDQDLGQPVYAAANGVVLASGGWFDSTWGNIVLIEHTLPDGTKVWSQYAHLQERKYENGTEVKKDDIVTRGQQIGKVGKGDGSISAHLHFEVRKYGPNSPSGQPKLLPNSFPCGKSADYVNSLYYNPIDFLNSHRPTSSPPPAGDFSINIIPFVTINVPGDTALFTVLTNTISGNPQPITLGVTGLPGASPTFNPPTITSGQSSVLAIPITPSMPSGDYSLRITGTGTVSHFTTAQLTISGSPKASFTMTGCGKSATNNQTLQCPVPPGGTMSLDFDSSTSQPGAGNTIKAWEWKLDGIVVGNLSRVTRSLSAGTHSINLDIMNSALIHDSTSGTVVVSETSAPGPFINFISPTSVAPSTFDLTINGSGFDGAAIDQVFLGNQLIGNGQIQSRSGTQIVVREFMTGATPTGYTVKVKNSDGQLSNGAVLTLTQTQTPGPTISSISPSSVAPGTFDLTINGVNFDGTAIDQVFLGSQFIGNGQIFSRIGSTQIVVREFMTGASTGAYTVKVKNSDGQLSNGLGLTLTQTQPVGPTINSISPTSVSPSTFDLTIIGSNFDSGAIDQVYLGGTLIGNGTIQSRSSTQIIVREFMTGASSGNYTVKVKNSNGQLSNGLTLTLTQTQGPTVTSISPTTVPPSTFDLTINGSDFDSGAIDQVYLGSTLIGNGTIQSRTSTQIVVREFMTGASAGNYTVKVKNSNGQLSNGLTLTLNASPSISSISPSSVAPSAFTLTINGSNFDGGAIDQVFLGSQLIGNGTIQSRTSTQIVVQEFMTGASAGSYTVKVKNSDGQLSNGATLSLTAAPVINSISPTSVAPSTFTLTINGSNFDGGAIDQIFLGSTLIGNGTIQSRTSTQIVVQEFMTGASPGSYTVKVKNSNGALSNGSTLTLNSPPTLSSISPTSVVPSTFTLTINGSNFDGGAIDQIFLGSTLIGNGTIQSRSSTQIVVQEFMTGASAGSYTVKVKNADGQLSNGATLTLTASPVVNSISPTSVAPSTFTLTINGSNFDGGAIDQIFLGSTLIGNGTIQSRSSTQIVVQEFMTGASPGSYTVKVKNSNGALSNGLTLTLNSAPTLSSISPTSVAPSTFTLTINGSNFDGGAIDQVFLGSQLIGNGTIQSRSSTQIVVQEFMTGASPGSYTVKVKNSDGQLSNGATLTLTAAPVLNSISPTSVAPSTFTLTINGSNFDGGAIDQVFLGSTLIGNGTIQSRSSTQIVVQEFMTGASPGSYTVKVKNSNGQLSNGLTLTLTSPAPNISSINPSTVPASTFDLTISGSGFDGGAIDQIFVGSTLIGNGTILSRSNTQIVVREFMTGASLGNYTVKVKNSDGQLSNGVTLTLASLTPSINTISPSAVAPSTFDLTINGNNFDGGAIDQIFVGSTLIGNGTILSRSNTQIVVREFMTGATKGNYTVKVKNSNAQLSNGVTLTLQ